MLVPEIVEFDNARHREQVIGLWDLVFGYGAAHNAPALVIDTKLAVADRLFFVAMDGHKVLGAVMAGYDGHRGWIYSLAVHPEHRKRGIGTQLLAFAEQRLSVRGCFKINLQIIEENEEVQGFYESNGYSVERRTSMGKRLSGSLPPSWPSESGTSPA